MTSQYETNLWSTHVNIFWLAEPIRCCVHQRTQVFKIEGSVCKCFLPSPPSPPSFILWLLFVLGLSLLQNQTEMLATQAKCDKVWWLQTHCEQAWIFYVFLCFMVWIYRFSCFCLAVIVWPLSLTDYNTK